MRQVFALSALLCLAGCGCGEKDPYALSPEEAKAAARRVRPGLPSGPPGKDPVRIQLPPPKDGKLPDIPPGAVPLRGETPDIRDANPFRAR